MNYLKGSRPSRRNYQTKRSDTYRKSASLITSADLSAELKNKLFPGVKDSQTASERLEAYNTERAITLTVTTRAIGFSCFSIFQSIFSYNQVPARGTIYQLYRVSLATFESKVIISNRGIRQVQDVLDDYLRLRMNNDTV